MDDTIDYFCNNELTPSEIEATIEYYRKNDNRISLLHSEMKVPIIVKECGEGIRALYHIKKREIWISPYQTDTDTLKNSLLHESIHAYDHLVKKLDISKLEGLAMSEVHAAKHCECNSFLFRKKCTRTKSINAVNCSIHDPDASKKAVDDIFDIAFSDDYYPF